MEMHHRLRRDPSWHPSGCNICGQLGHQAAQCTTGTVNWQAMYGENAFRVRPAVFQSELDAIKKAKQIDFAKLEKEAQEYAKVRLEGGPKREPPPQFRKQQPQQQAQPHVQQQQPAASAAAPVDGAKAKADEEKQKAEEGLPEGWGVAFDAQKRPYYWHKVTRKTVWEKPTADTPIS